MTLAEQAEQIAPWMGGECERILLACAAALREREGAQQAGQVPYTVRRYLQDVLESGTVTEQIVARTALSLLAATTEAPAQPEQASTTSELLDAAHTLVDALTEDTMAASARMAAQPGQKEREAFNEWQRGYLGPLATRNELTVMKNAWNAGVAWARTQSKEQKQLLEDALKVLKSIRVASGDPTPKEKITAAITAHFSNSPEVPRCQCCGTTRNLHRDVGSGGPWRCDSPNCMVY